MKTALTIAGSDPGAGAGLQADLKTFAALGVYGVCAITAVTVQNTLGVVSVTPLAADLVTAQIEAVAGDIAIHATLCWCPRAVNGCSMRTASGCSLPNCCPARSS
jgi:hydroxymethylpyrimidine kinase/phosphomethylpyrimidine kinase